MQAFSFTRKLALPKKRLAVLHFSGRQPERLLPRRPMRKAAAARSFAVVLFVLVFLTVGRSQTPFLTDDADVTDKGKVHLEFVNEFDVLQTSLHPSLSQNTFVARFAIGVHKRIELGIDVPAIAIFNSREASLRRSSGISDINAHIKIKLIDEHEGSRLPAFAVAFYTQFPTGKVSKSLGSGVTDYSLYGVAQKSLTKKTTLRANAGILFAGNTVFGIGGLRKINGRLFSGGVSVIREFTDRLSLGGEIVGVADSDFDLGHGQLQTTLGGNYVLNKKLTLDLGFVLGRFPASPRAGAVIGITIDP